MRYTEGIEKDDVTYVPLSAALTFKTLWALSSKMTSI